MADIFSEIDEDLRRDRLDQIWQRYRGWIIGGAVAIVLATAAGVAWHDYQQAEYDKIGQRYADAETLAKTDPAKAISAFQQLAAETGTDYAELARLRAASLKAEGVDKPGGIAGLQAIAADGSVDEPYRSLAAILAAQFGIDDTPPGELIERLQPFTAATNPWRFSAIEMTALAQLKSGDKAAALKSYQLLVDDPATPHSLHARAQEVIAALSH